MRCGARGAGREAAGRGAVAAQAACTGRARLKAGGHRARAERTLNMRIMFVTLDVSKLSGWLKASAACRVESRACDAGRGASREAGVRRTAAAQVVCTGRGPN
eukprot:scaffold34414_cov60-Phaeocystis_antarctica.AAC.5